MPVRVMLGKLGPGSYGLRVTGPTGTVIIDGTSNMFAIVATGELEVFAPAPAPGTIATSTTSTTLATGQNYVPAFHAFLEADPGGGDVVGIPLPSTDWDADGHITDIQRFYVVDLGASSSISARAEWSARVDYGGIGQTHSYFILREAAF